MEQVPRSTLHPPPSSSKVTGFTPRTEATALACMGELQLVELVRRRQGDICSQPYL